MKTFSAKLSLCVIVVCVVLACATAALAQQAHANATTMQAAATALSTLPDADVLLYVSPQRILNEAAPQFMPPTELARMRSEFAEVKKSVGIDPSTVEYLVIAVRFHKPASDLSFVAPDVLAVAGGDFSADSLFTVAQLAMAKGRVEKHGSKSIAVMRVDPIAVESEKMPMLKSLIEMGIVPLSANSIAVGNLPYLESAVDAAETGTGRINPATLQSLMRDPNVLMASTGAPLTSFAKAFGLLGTDTTPRTNQCDTSFGNFYSSVTVNGTNFSFRGAMNADNPDTAKIISGLLAGLMQQGINSIPDKQAQTMLQNIKMTPRESEIVWEAEFSQQMLRDIFKPKPAPPPVSAPAPKPAPRRPVRKKTRSRH